MATAYERLEAARNHTLINSILKELPNNARITRATKGNIKRTLDDLNSNLPAWNGFTNALINRIGTVVVRNMSWTNPLAEFKTGRLEYGDSVEEINIDLVRGRSYDTDRDYMERDLFGQHKPDAQMNLHRVNRRDYYPITVNRDLLAEAFTAEGGLMNFVNDVLEAPYTSDQWDEFLLMCSLFGEYESRGGFHRINVPDARSFESDSSDAKAVLRKVRAMAENLTFPSTKYNAAGVSKAAKRDDLILFGTPDFFASVDVEALAGAFNVEKMSAPGRQFSIPDEEFGLAGAQAILTTKDFFMVKDRLLENTSQVNGLGLYTNYFLHHWQIISASRFAPAVLFHTGADDTEAIVIKPVTGMGAITFADYRTGENVTLTTEQPRGGILQLNAVATGDDGADVSVSWSVAGNTDPRTHVTKDGVLHVGGEERSEKITVTASSVGIDPQSPNADRFTSTRDVSIDLESPEIPQWPNDDREPDTLYNDDPVDPENGV